MKEFICSVCPEGCRVFVDEAGNISGNGCPNGAALAKKDLAIFGRVFSGSVAVLGGVKDNCAVESTDKIPRSRVYAAMEALRPITIFAPVKAGDVIISDFLGLGINLISAEDIAEI